MAGKGAKIIAGSFWIIAAIHIAVFTAIGVATSSWRLLVIFLVGFVLIMAVWAGAKLYFGRHPEKKDAMMRLPLLRRVLRKGDN